MKKNIIDVKLNLDLEEFLKDKFYLQRFWFKLNCLVLIIFKGRVNLIFKKHGLDTFLADPSIYVFKEASSEYFNQIRKKLKKHFRFNFFYFDSREIDVDHPEFLEHLKNLDIKSKDSFEERLKQNKCNKSYICTFGFRTQILYPKFFNFINDSHEPNFG